MVTEYLGAVKLFAGNFAIKGYAMCQGQLMSIQQSTALFSLLGTYYGGNGVSNFQLPDLRGRLPIGFGNGQGLSPHAIGELGGIENVTMLSVNVPSHNHVFNASTSTASLPAAGPGNLLGAVAAGTEFYATAGGSGVTPVAINPNAISQQGGNLPHNNVQPSMALTYIIALQGVFPTQG